MPATLKSFEDTEHVNVDGECKKLKDWTFESQEYCARGGCDPELLLIFEDGTTKYAKQVPELRNC